MHIRKPARRASLAGHGTDESDVRACGFEAFFSRWAAALSWSFGAQVMHGTSDGKRRSIDAQKLGYSVKLACASCFGVRLCKAAAGSTNSTLRQDELTHTHITLKPQILINQRPRPVIFNPQTEWHRMKRGADPCLAPQSPGRWIMNHGDYG